MQKFCREDFHTQQNFVLVCRSVLSKYFLPKFSEIVFLIRNT